jgi:hypothetical protein
MDNWKKEMGMIEEEKKRRIRLKTCMVPRY